MVKKYFLLSILYALQGYYLLLERRREIKCKIVLSVIFLVVFLIAQVQTGPLVDSFKISQDTELYYEYVHRHHNDFMWLRY